MTSKGIIKFISHPENSHYSLEERSDDGDSSCTITSGTHFRFTFPRHCRILRHPQNIRKRQVSRHLKSATLSTVVSDRRSYYGRRGCRHGPCYHGYNTFNRRIFPLVPHSTPKLRPYKALPKRSIMGRITPRDFGIFGQYCSNADSEGPQQMANAISFKEIRKQLILRVCEDEPHTQKHIIGLL